MGNGNGLWIVLIVAVLFAGEMKSQESNREPDVKAVAVEDVKDDVWLELPLDKSKGDDIHRVTHRAMMDGKLQRNYSYCYDEDYYASYWVAYPLCESHISSGRAEFWSFDDKVDERDQTDVRHGYGASLSTENYERNFYARGHQIPNADRSAVAQMQSQTYFSTNMTPQLQNGFNGGIWARLESAIRAQVANADTLYVVTGASFSKSGKPEKIKTIINKNDSKTLSVPNYYWKAVLKVRRDSAGNIAGASAIGFWLPHKDLKGHTYQEYTVSADSIETWTGLNLFYALPDSIENKAESNVSWSSFCNF